MIDPNDAIVRQLGRRDYEQTWHAMREFTLARTETTPDEIWLVEHAPVYTLGRNAKNRPLARNGIPVIETDRGGDITYHGPGQAVMYPLLDLRRLNIGVKVLVQALERSAIDLLAEHDIVGERRPAAPGVYVEGRKIAALGLRIRQGCSYHGLSLNVDMDLAPFRDIYPCGYQGLEVTQLRDLGIDLDVVAAGDGLARHLARGLGYNALTPTQETA